LYVLRIRPITPFFGEGQLTPINFPGATFTGAYGISNAGEIAGRTRAKRSDGCLDDARFGNWRSHREGRLRCRRSSALIPKAYPLIPRTRVLVTRSPRQRIIKLVFGVK